MLRRDLDVIADLSVELLRYKAKKNLAQLHEPDYTAALVLIFPVLANIIMKGRARFGGCYIHQSPKATFHSTVKSGVASCEVGDLLVVVRRNVDGKEVYNAMLLQLKRHTQAKNTPHILSSQGEMIQKELYTEWPLFSLSCTGTTTYDIYPKSITPGAQYMFIARANRLSSPWSMNTLFLNSYPATSTVLDYNHTFGDSLEHLIEWQNGRSISDELNSGSDDWSKLIWSLICKSRKGTFTRKNVGVFGEERSGGAFFHIMTDCLSDIFQGIESKEGLLTLLKERGIEAIANHFDESYSISDIENWDEDCKCDGEEGISTLFIDIMGTDYGSGN